MSAAANRRWESLLDLAVMLRQQEVDLDELAKQIQNHKTGHHHHHHHHRVLDPTIAALHHKSLIIKSGKVLNSTPPIQDSVSCRPTTVKKRTKRSREVEEQMSEKRRKIIYDHHHHHHLLLLDHDGKFTATWTKPIKKFIVKRNSRKVLKRKLASKRRKTTPETAEPILSEENKKRILGFGGSEESVCWVIEKTLYQSDVDTKLCRLSIPHGKINNKFFNKLDETEAARLESEPERIPVILFGHSGEEFEMSFRNWKSNNMYALVGHWIDVCHRDKLEVGKKVQVWCFRRDSHLCFALFLV